MNITYKEKDKVLFYLCENLIPEKYQQFSLPDFCSNTEITPQTLDVILSYFKRIGLIESFNLRYNTPIVTIIIYTECFDIFNRGGFTVQENMLQKEVEKLLLEIESLKPTLGNKIEQISTIGNNIAGIVNGILRGIIS